MLRFVLQSGLEKNLFGNYPVSSPHSHGPPPAFDSDPLNQNSVSRNAPVKVKSSSIDIMEIDGPGSGQSNHEANFSQSPNSGGVSNLWKCKTFLCLHSY